jgi:hypothetical protein
MLQHIVKLTTSTNDSIHGGHPLNYISLATQTEGYSATDLQDLVKRALHVAMIRAADEKSLIVRVHHGNSGSKLLMWYDSPPFLWLTSKKHKGTSLPFQSETLSCKNLKWSGTI